MIAFYSIGWHITWFEETQAVHDEEFVQNVSLVESVQTHRLLGTNETRLNQAAGCRFNYHKLNRFGNTLLVIIPSSFLILPLSTYEEVLLFTLYKSIWILHYFQSYHTRIQLYCFVETGNNTWCTPMNGTVILPLYNFIHN